MKFFDICANVGCYQRFSGSTPQEAAAKLLSHRQTCIDKEVAVTEIREATFSVNGQRYEYRCVD